MIRLILVVLFVLIFLAIKFIPWYINLGICVVLILLSKFLIGQFFKMLFMMPFKAKGKVLKGAAAQVHRVTAAGPPEHDRESPLAAFKQLKALTQGLRKDDPDESADNFDETGLDEDEELDEEERAARNVPRDYYDIEVTITPRKTTGPFHHWDLDDLRLVLPGKKWDDDDDSECEVYSINIVRDGIVIPARRISDLEDDDEADEDEDEDDVDGGDFGSKVIGPHRVKMHIGVRKDIRELAFGYYFERFGKVELPPS